MLLLLVLAGLVYLCVNISRPVTVGMVTHPVEITGVSGLRKELLIGREPVEVEVTNTPLGVYIE